MLEFVLSMLRALLSFRACIAQYTIMYTDYLSFVLEVLLRSSVFQVSMFESMQFQFGAGMAIFMLLLILLLVGLVLGLTIFWILMIVDCATRKKLSDGERVAWILVLVFLHFIGASIYYLAVKRK